MKAEILKMLRQSAGYLSGQQLCDHFQVSRTAVWKAINQLKEEGYEIEAVRNKGYRIVDIPDRITADAIKSCLETKWMAKNLEYYDEIDSTNNRAKALGEAGGADGTLFVAETQTAGKGRRGRCWQSPAGSSISMLIMDYAYHLPYLQIINSNNIGIALMQGLSGSFGIVLSVPATVAFAAWIYTGRK